MADNFNFNVNPNELYGFNEPKDEWNFEARERNYDSLIQGLEYKSKATLNLRKQNPK